MQKSVSNLVFTNTLDIREKRQIQPCLETTKQQRGSWLTNSGDHIETDLSIPFCCPYKIKQTLSLRTALMRCGRSKIDEQSRER